MIATENRSQDGTTEILESYAKAGQLHLIREDAEYLRQAEWITRMGRLAASEFGADWVVNSDAEGYGGSGVGNLGGVEAEAKPWHGQPYSATLTIPPLATVWLLHEG